MRLSRIDKKSCIKEQILGHQMAVCNIRNPNRSITYSNGDSQLDFDDSERTRNEKSGPLRPASIQKMSSFYSMNTREALSSSRDEKVTPPAVTITTTGWSPAPLSADGIAKSTVYTPGSTNTGLLSAVAIWFPMRID